MMLNKAIVVAVHPDDHSVDLVMVNTRARYTGIQVMSKNGSSRSGSIDLPEVPERADKWDISTNAESQVTALVDEVGYTPVVMGFIYPQISQMTHTDGRLKYDRHTSDVQTYTDGDGNMGILHPSGAHILLAEGTTPRSFDGQNVDKSSKIDRNTGKKVTLTVAMAGNVATLTMTPDGFCSLALNADLNVTCQNANVTAHSDINLTANMTTVHGDMHVTGAVTTDSTITSTGDQTANGISTAHHKHIGDGKPDTPQPTSEPKMGI